MKTLQSLFHLKKIESKKKYLLIKKQKFMKKLILISAFILLILTSGINEVFSQVSQEWLRYWYLNNFGSMVKCAATDNSGNSVISGTSILGGTDIVTLRYTPQGDLQWIKIYDNKNLYNSEDGVSDLVLDAQGNIYLTGYTANSVGANKNIVTIKYSPAGDSLWVRHFGGIGNSHDEGKAITLDESGNVYVTGYSTTSGTNKDYLTIKYDNNGNQIWVRNSSYATSAENTPSDIVADNQGNVYVTGHTQIFLTLKYNSVGDLMWIKTYSGNCCGTNEYKEKKLEVDKSGNVFVTGNVKNSITNDDLVTIKYDSLGNQVWLKSYNSPSNGSDYASALKLVYEPGDEMHPDLVVAGTSRNNFLTTKYDGDNGNVLWQKINSDVYQSAMRSMAIDKLGNVVVAGNRFNVSTGGDDFLTVKYDGVTGDERFAMMYNLGGNENVVNVSLGPDGAAYVSGTSAIWTNHFLIVKYKELDVLNLKVFIEGMYDNFTNTMVPDTVNVYLRNAASPFAIADSSKLQLGSDGKGIFKFRNSTPGTPYYIIVKHRNSLETWSADPLTFTGTSVNYDFTTSPDKAYGNNLVQKGSKYCIVSGELDGDGYIDASDMSILENDFSNNLSGYINSDLNGDLILDASDLSIVANSTEQGFAAMSPEIDAGLSMRGLHTGKHEVKKNIIHEKKEAVNVLKDNYPNPFNPSTMISFDLRTSGNVSVKVYDALGKEVAVLVNEFKDPGIYNVRFDASNLSSGMYFYKLQAEGFTQTKKMLLVK